MSTSSRVIKNTGYLYIKTLVSMFVTLYVTRLVLRTLGTEDFGIYDVVGGAISMLGFLNTSMASTVQRFLNNAQGQNDALLQRKVFNIGVCFHIIIALSIVVILAILYIFLFNGILNISSERIDAAKIVYLCLVVSTFFNILTVPYDASINAHEDMLTYSIIGIIDIFLKLGVAIAITQTSMDKLVLYGILMMIVPIATYAMMRFWSVRHYEECVLSIRKYYDKSVARQMLSFSGWSLVGTSSSVVGNYGNNIVMNHFYGATLNAVMGIANQFQGMLIVLSSGLSRALNPVIYKSGGRDQTQMLQYSYLGCKYSFLLLAFFAIPVIIETPFVLNLWLGQIPLWAVLFVRLQLLRCLLEQLTSTLNKALEAVGKIKEYNIAVFTLNVLPILVLSIAYSLGMEPYMHYVVAIVFMVLLVGLVKIIFCIKYCNLSFAEYSRIVLWPCLICTALPITIGFALKHIIGTSLFPVLATILIVIIVTLIAAFFTLSSVERSVMKSLTGKLIEYIKNNKR